MQPPYKSDAPVAWENYVVTQTAYALLGFLGPGIRAVGCRISDDAVEVHFAVPVLTDEEQEDIAEIADDLATFIGTHTLISTVTHIGLSELDWDALGLRGVYLAKTPSAHHSGNEYDSNP